MALKGPGRWKQHYAGPRLHKKGYLNMYLGLSYKAELFHRFCFKFLLESLLRLLSVMAYTPCKVE